MVLRDDQLHGRRISTYGNPSIRATNRVPSAEGLYVEERKNPFALEELEGGYIPLAEQCHQQDRISKAAFM